LPSVVGWCVVTGPISNGGDRKADRSRFRLIAAGACTLIDRTHPGTAPQACSRPRHEGQCSPATASP
jgi:hypothetical protein